MFEIITPIDSILLKFVKKNSKLAVEYAKEILIKEGIPYDSNKNFTTFNVDNTRYLVRISRGSSSKKELVVKTLLIVSLPKNLISIFIHTLDMIKLFFFQSQNSS